MNIDDILKLNNEIESLNIIQDFLSRSITHTDYETAIYMYLKIAFFNNQNELVLSEGLKSLLKFEDKEPTKFREKIYSFLIDSSIILNKFDLAEEYISKRKEILPIMEQYLSILDELRITKAKNQNILPVLLKLKNEILPLELNITIQEELLNEYLKDKNYDSAFNILNELMSISLKEEYEVVMIEILFFKEEYIEVIEKAEQQVKNNIKDSKVVIYLIASLIKLNKLRNASSLEAEYEELIENTSDLDLRSFAYNTIIKLYENLGNKLSVDLYSKKLKKITKKEVVKEPKSKVIEKEVVKIKEVATQTLVSSAKYLEHFDWVQNWLIYSHQINLKTVFREYLRELFIEINSKINLKEIILYINEGYDSNFFNFKKERLYDKLVINQYIEESIIKDTINKKQHIFGEPTRILSKKDVLTQEVYKEEIKYVYCFYINDKTVILFYLDELLDDPSIYYELLHGITKIIETRLIDEKNVLRLQRDARRLDSILNNNVIATRVLTEYNSNYNKVSVDLFKIESKFHLELFLRELPLEEAREYEKAVERLFIYPNETKILSYSFQDKKITEYLFAIKEQNETVIVSYFTDNSNFYSTNESLSIKANVCLETKLKNKNQLYDDLNNYLKNKSTFVLIELNQELSNIYGNIQMNKFFIEFAYATNKHFINYNVYRFDFNQLLVVFDFNDIRSVNNELNSYFQVVNHLKSKVLKYEKYNAKAGILRYPVVTIERNIDRLFRYLDVSLQKSKSSKEIDYVHFIQSDYEKEVFEQEIIDYLNTAIENKQLSINFRQIIDVNNNIVWNYESRIYLPNINIDSKYLITIAKKRKKIVDLELYHLEAVCSFLNKLETETDHLIKLTVPISKETFLSHGFQSYLFQILKQYKIPAEFIRILVNVNETSQSDSLRISEVIKSGISIDTTNVETALSNDFNAVHLKLTVLNNKWKQYYKEVNSVLANNAIALVLRNVNTKEQRDTLKSIGINYIEGTIYNEIKPSEIIQKIKDVTL